ncbi:alpha/beta hydrolase [Hymenobacter oligotrophus]|uniref:Alpha/beta hydrolase n=1 Tax=Hymenobacter oligotrophus TaxID=2319843 RepID=A0A3B7R617_9BACT|nr:alpha/beta hydrolase [Hymenobacter oligotrophus]AYA36649.1 alpha/beta hydrolase [Hymenobacter oligotrophus]
MNVIQRNNVHVLGKGEQTLVFVNGFGCDQTMWRYLLPSFAQAYKIVLFDHVGAGSSATEAYLPEKYTSLQGYADDLLEICEHLQLQQPILVAHSVGAMIGALAAIARPELFRQAIMIGASPCYINANGYYGGFERADLEAMLAYMERDYVGWADTFGPFIMGEPDRPSLAAELTHSLCQTNPTIARQFARVTFLSDNRLDVTQIPIPCLLLQCAHDLIAPPEVGDFLSASIPAAHLVTLPVTGHCPQLSAPAETAAAIELHLAY